jgi:hypothetical protein
MKNLTTIYADLTLDNISNVEKSGKSNSNTLDYAFKFFGLKKDHSFDSLDQIDDLLNISILFHEKNFGPIEDKTLLKMQLIRELALKNMSIYFLLANNMTAEKA